MTFHSMLLNTRCLHFIQSFMFNANNKIILFLNFKFLRQIEQLNYTIIHISAEMFSQPFPNKFAFVSHSTNHTSGKKLIYIYFYYTCLSLFSGGPITHDASDLTVRVPAPPPIQGPCSNFLVARYSHLSGCF